MKKIRALQIYLMFLGVLISNLSIAQTMHVIAFADTKNQITGKTNLLSLENAVNEFGIAADVIGYDYKTYVGMDDKCEKDQLVKYIRSLETSDDDIVVFYYSGHGMRSLEQSDKYPQLCLNYNTIDKQNCYVSVKAIDDILNRLNCRLKIIITDCSNSVNDKLLAHDIINVKLKNNSIKVSQRTKGIYENTNSLNAYATFSDLSSYNPNVHSCRSDRMEIVTSSSTIKDSISETAIRKLLCIPRGVIKVNSSDVGQFSYSNNFHGGIFTNSLFCHIISAEYEEIPATWKDILDYVKKDVIEISENKQKPIYDINISYDLLDELVSSTDSTLLKYASQINLSDSAEWYLIDPYVTSMTTSDETLVHGEILDSKHDGDILSTKCATLIHLYKHNKSNSTCLARESTFMPDICVRFDHNGSFITLSCSTYDDMIRLSLNQDEFIEFEDNTMCSKIIEGALSKFPKDKYLRNLYRKRK